jgi:hypothetical protein
MRARASSEIDETFLVLVHTLRLYYALLKMIRAKQMTFA